MLRPEPMSRVLIVGPRDALDGVVEALYGLRLVHLIDYKGEDEAFKIGKPLAKASIVSEELVKLRSISSILQQRIREDRGDRGQGLEGCRGPGGRVP